MATTDFDRDKERVRNSKFADLNNSPGREGHAVIAGTFLGEFAEDTPWVHLDIAGTSETKGAHDLGPAGATGQWYVHLQHLWSASEKNKSISEDCSNILEQSSL